MKKAESDRNKTKQKEYIEHIKKNRVSFTIYIILRLIATFSLVISMFRGNYENALLCVATLMLLLAPAFVEKRFSIELPTALEVIVMCFVFAHTILGEIGCFYVKVQWWDTMLHTLNGFICAGVGFSLVDLLNRHKRFKFELSPMYVAIVAFCFSMTVGVLWEFFEFGMDMLFDMDMQKDTVINTINSVALDQTNTNTVVTMNGINDVTVNGKELGLNGYLDIGLIDTMKDLIVNFIGAVIFSVSGFFYVKYRGKKNTKFIEGLVPAVSTDVAETVSE